EAHFTHNIKITNPEVKNIQLEIAYQACVDMCISQNKFFVFDLATVSSKEVQNFEDLATTSINNDTTKTAPNTDNIKKGSKIDTMDNWAIFVASFLGGLVALLTPCVFPMIPMTVSFFTKQSKSRAKGIKNALIYGLSI